MSPAQAFANYLESQDLATVNENLFISRLPAAPRSADDQWAVLMNGGPKKTGGNVLQWRQTISLRVLYRHKSGQAIYDADALLQEATSQLTRLDGKPVIALSVSPMIDNDLDSEERHQASWVVEFDTTT